jgi:formylmethanofuran dehydrogenase subunit E
MKKIVVCVRGVGPVKRPPEMPTLSEEMLRGEILCDRCNRSAAETYETESGECLCRDCKED